MRRVIRPERRRENGAAPGDGFWSKERIPGVRDACGESRKGMKKAREVVYPIARQWFFGRRTRRAGNLPSEEKKVVYPIARQWFFQQITHLGLDTYPAV
jgi:hypothetical protein